MIHRIYILALAVLALGATLAVELPKDNSTAAPLLEANRTREVARRSLPYPGSCVDQCGIDCDRCNEITFGNYIQFCASDGVTYNNFESLNCINQCNGASEEITFEHFGSCGNPITTTMRPPITIPNPPVVPQNIFPRCICLRNVGQLEMYKPFCGSDGYTYNCEEDAKCFSFCYNKDIQKLYDGPCEAPATIMDNCKCKYSFYSDPVCGSDGLTYSNSEALFCSNYCTKKRVKELFKGNCGGFLRKVPVPYKTRTG